MSYLTKEQLLKAGPKRKDVVIPELGTVSVKQLTAKEVVEYAKLQQELKGSEAIAYAVIHGVVDADGKQLFSDADKDAIMGLGHEVVNTLIEEIFSVSRLTVDAAEKK